jgi:diguanylate cyclase (GGDEF)-like protein
VSIAGRINLLVIGMALALSTVVALFAVDREYRFARDHLEAEIPVRVIGQPDLPSHIYFREKERLGTVLEGFLQSSAVAYAEILDPAGALLLRRNQISAPTSGSPPFEALRGSTTATVENRVTLGADDKPAGEGWLGALLDGQRHTHLTIPIFSALNPLAKNLSRADFARAIVQRDVDVDAGGFVVGYVHVAISGRRILDQISFTLALTTLGCLVFVLISGGVAIAISRRITAPLSRLVELADDVAAGRLRRPVEVGGSGEITEIERILNGMVGGLSSYKTQMDVDHHLLSMKVDERTAQLSRRNEELKKAVAEVTQTKDRLRHMAYYDSLTSLPNRRLFGEQLDLLLRMAKREGDRLALLFLDLDNFKRINDSLGHSAGDLLLKEVGQRLAGCLRESDLVASNVETGHRIDVSRLGGDEFTVVLNRLDRVESAGPVAQRLLDALSEPMLIEGHEVVVTPSIGIAVAPGDAEDVEGLLKAADTAMYHAKSQGRNNYVFYQSDMDSAGIERLKLETDLRKAVEREELVLFYQPQIDTRNGTVVGAEALLRWHHPEHGLVSPAVFVPLAEEMGLIGDLGEWALREACRQVKEFAAEGIQLPMVAVNVSALQFNTGYIGKVKGILRETGVEPQSLQLELTEGVVMADTSTTVQGLQELKDMGVSLAVDDFGTGYSSLNYLSRFPLDELKIDRSFVTNSLESENDASLVVAIIALARSLNLRLVAEGVETREQYQFLTGNGAHIIQGYLFSKPVPADDLRPLLAPWHFMQQIQDIANDGIENRGLELAR